MKASAEIKNALKNRDSARRGKMKKVKFDEAQDKDLLKDKGIEEKDDDSIDHVQVGVNVPNLLVRQFYSLGTEQRSSQKSKSFQLRQNFMSTFGSGACLVSFFY